MNKTVKNYKRTQLACYLGFVTQAILANFAPLLYTTFHSEYGISLGSLALISTCFFFTQLLVDSFCAVVVDRLGYRVCIVTSEIASAAGLIGLAVLPGLLPSPFVGILICVFIYALGSGLIEVLCSPIIEACPFDNKDRVMSFLHSFYCWGTMAVVILSTLFFSAFGTGKWRILACLWALVPFYNVFNFVTCPIEPLVEDGKSMSIGELLKTKLFWLLIVLMVCSGSSELALGQWASAFVESALHVSKTVGDLAGPCGFALLMGISRVLYSRIGGKVDLTGFMAASGILCVLCYLLAAFAELPVMGLIGCALCGFSVGIMWPGSLSISSSVMPKGGTAMFALLALGGDLGGSIGPAIVGAVSQRAGDDLQAGLLAGIGFPAVLVLCVLVLRKMKSAGKISS
ncbi:MAG: MFS transporter [Eubacteriales bacterium]|nr:MFS transporter [Eubacteriales bacterium]